MNYPKEDSFFKKLFGLLNSKHKKDLLILAFLLILAIFFEMLGLGILIPAITVLLDPDIGSTYPELKPILNFFGNPDHKSLIFWGLFSVIFVYFFKGGFLTVVSYKQTKFAQNLTADLSSGLFKGYLKMPYTFHLLRNSSELYKNILTEVSGFSNATKDLISLIVELSMILGIFSTLVYIEPLGTLSLLLFLILAVGLFHFFTKNKLQDLGKKRINHSLFINKHVLQGLSGVKEVILSDKQFFFTKLYDRHNYSIAKLHTYVGTLRLVPRLYLELLAVIALSAVIIILTYRNVELVKLIPTIGVFVAAAFRMLPSFNRILGAFQSITFIGPLMDLLHNEYELINNNTKKVIHKKLDFIKSINLNKIYYKYENTNVNALENVTIKIKKGEFIGIIGESGSGKTTLLNIILGLIKPETGKLIVDNEIVDHKSIKNWQKKIGYVPQTIYLLDESLKANIAFGVPNEEIDNALVNKVIQIAQLNNLVNELPKGIDTFVGERGVRLSGGQRQRIGIARALYNDPDILVLDEATSALDNSTEKEFMKSIEEIRQDKTIIVVAHRLSTVRNCDKLYKLKSGKVLVEGPPSKLIKL